MSWLVHGAPRLSAPGSLSTSPSVPATADNAAFSASGLVAARC
ncbi:Uncharacterised protein [Mycobacteroides abscessus subsp. abscessus]|nr:Uncharacterised protein [Mycobacteroides abscessus subsp. abscessus]